MKERGYSNGRMCFKFMSPLIYRLHAEFNLSEMQREGRQLKRAMIVDAKSGSRNILFQCPNGKRLREYQVCAYVCSLEITIE